MIFSLISRLIASSVVYLYPSYATYKTLARRPGTEQDVEKWLIYWCVLGAITAFETSFEWLVDWVWLYTEMKTIVLLFVSQGGAGIIYRGFLEPQYEHYEPEIDAHLASLRTQTFAYIQAQIQKVYGLILGSVASQNDPTPRNPQGGANAGSAAEGAGKVAQDLWNSYGPGVLAAGAKYMGGGAKPAGSAPPSPNRSPNSFGARDVSPGRSTPGFNPGGPSFPVPQFTSDVHPAGIPLPRSSSNLPLPRGSPSNSSSSRDTWDHVE